MFDAVSVFVRPVILLVALRMYYGEIKLTVKLS